MSLQLAPGETIGVAGAAASGPTDEGSAAAAAARSRVGDLRSSRVERSSRSRYSSNRFSVYFVQVCAVKVDDDDVVVVVVVGIGGRGESGEL